MVQFPFIVGGGKGEEGEERRQEEGRLYRYLARA